jgi:hypothetical protein
MQVALWTRVFYPNWSIKTRDDTITLHWPDCSIREGKLLYCNEKHNFLSQERSKLTAYTACKVCVAMYVVPHGIGKLYGFLRLDHFPVTSENWRSAMFRQKMHYLCDTLYTRVRRIFYSLIHNFFLFAYSQLFFIRFKANLSKYGSCSLHIRMFRYIRKHHVLASFASYSLQNILNRFANKYLIWC